MGLDDTTYLGPYLHCKVSKTDSKTIRRTCTNNTCPNRNGCMYSKFCHQCGSPIGDVEFSVKANTVNICELRKKINEALATPCGDYFDELSKNGIDIWFGNWHRPSKSSRSFTCDDTQLTPIEAGVVKNEIDEFVLQYKSAIAVIEEAYGKDNVEVKWGLIHYIW
jgi:hypothetical protein